MSKVNKDKKFGLNVKADRPERILPKEEKPAKAKIPPQEASAARKSTAIQKEAMIKALKASLGNVSAACESVGISRQTHYRWLEEDEDYSVAFENIGEQVLDFAETSLVTQIKEKNTAATIFYLKTKGKKRGYIEAVVNINNEVEDDISGMSDEELYQLAQKGEGRLK